MACCNYRLTTIIILMIEVLVIISLIGVYGWITNSSKPNLRICRHFNGSIPTEGSLKNVELDDDLNIVDPNKLDCPKVRALIAVYTLLLVFMIISNILGWLICCLAPRFCFMLFFLVFNISSLMTSILLLVHFSDSSAESVKKGGNIGIGVVTTLMNITLCLNGYILLSWYSNHENFRSDEQVLTPHKE